MVSFTFPWRASCSFEAWQRRYEEQSAAAFLNSRGKYEEILRQWTIMFPATCGGVPPAPGFVNFESIAEEDGGTYSLDLNGRLQQHLAGSEVGKKLGVPERPIAAILAAMRSIGSPEVIQSGQVFKIVDRRNDTHGILHIDPACADASQLKKWSEYQWDPSAGPYTRLRDLGGGWYYYAESR